jgi:hypothetical protein
MRIEELKRVKNRQPFEPFALRMVDGTVLPVERPDWLSVPPIRRPHEVAYLRPKGAAARTYDVLWLDINLICEVIASSAPARGGSK